MENIIMNSRHPALPYNIPLNKVHFKIFFIFYLFFPYISFVS